MQVILGAGGDIGFSLAKELKKYTDTVRLVARNPKKLSPDDQLFPADLKDYTQVENTVKGADVAYLTVGLKYDVRIWQQDWPVIMQNVIQACISQDCKLVFFDNVYMYAQTEIPHMTESSLMAPPSLKGKVRLHLVEMIREAMVNKGLKAIIARSADFYGPNARNGLLNVLLCAPLKKGNKMMWQSDADKFHTFTYTVDAARATALLGNTEDAYQQVWHLPTSTERLTGKDFVRKMAALAGKKPSFLLLTPFKLRLFGIFDGLVKNLVEMQYQNRQDYFFDSSKFCKRFDFKPTEYDTGLKEMWEAKM